MSFDNLICNTINGLAPTGNLVLTLTLDNTAPDSFIPFSAANGAVIAMETCDGLKVNPAGNSATIFGTQLASIPGTANGLDFNPAFPLRDVIVRTEGSPGALNILANSSSSDTKTLKIEQQSTDPAALMIIKSDNGLLELSGDSIQLESTGSNLKIQPFNSTSVVGQVLTATGTDGETEWADIPSQIPSLTGNANKILTCNSGETAIEFTAFQRDLTPLVQGAAVLATGTSLAQRILTESGGVANSGANFISSTISGVYIDPAEYPSYLGKTAYISMRSIIYTNGTTPDSNYDFGVFPVTTSGPSTQMIYTVGSVLGSVFTVNAPAANSVIVTTSSNIPLPGSAGVYCMGVQPSAVSNSLVAISGLLSIVYA